jgi:hypothetical protein
MLHPKSSDVDITAVPVSVELLLEYLACLDIKWAPACVEMLKDLNWGGVAVGSIEVLEL